MESLLNWIKNNKLTVNNITSENEVTILTIDNVGKFLYIQPFENKIINEDFSFFVNEEEYDLLDSSKVNFILFEFGNNFYYSKIQKDKNKYNEIIFKPEFNDFKYLGVCNEESLIEYAHLGVHSEFEILNGSGSTELWAKKAKFVNCKYLGICDENTLAGTLSFQTYCEKFDIKPVIGETINVAINYNSENANHEIFKLKLFVLNEIGWKNLLLINKKINVNYDKFIPEHELLELGNGLACIFDKDSYLNYNIKNKILGIKIISKYKVKFDKIYYQIDTIEYTSQQLFLKHLSNLDNYFKNFKKILKPILINDSYYLDQEESSLKMMLNKISGKAQPESKNQYFKTFLESIDSYAEWSEVDPLYDAILKGAENAAFLAKTSNFKINTGERKLPHFEVKNVNSLFFDVLEKGVQERLGNLKGKEFKKYLNRIETECNVIVPNGLTDYFMILWDIIRYCKDNGIMVGTGRGSVCGSLVAYCLHITDVDPLKYGLMFERFLNETRVSGERSKSADSMPDIDVDFPTKNREEVVNYIKQHYGNNYTCSIGTYTRMKLKTCIKDFAKIKGLPFDYTNRLTSDIDDQIEYTWGDLIEYASKSKLLFDFVQKYPDIVHLTKYALLQPKAESVHPSALVIVPKFDFSNKKADLFTWMPVKKIDGILVSEWEGKYIDKSGFLKEDILGLSQLDKFKSIIDLIKINTGKEINTNEIPLDDSETIKYFKRGWNEDVFQFGTTGLMNYCRQVKPDNLDNLIAMTALFRPGPMDVNAHQDFSDIKNGKKKPVYDFGMENITGETYGLYVYQEQIMKAVIVGGLTEVESDILRTTIKKKDVKTLSAFGDKFKKGYIKLLNKNNIKNSEDYADKVWNKLLAFSGYGFNKSHAAAYTIMSYWSQWFKVNYPLEFWTTSLQFSTESLVSYRLAEIKKTGVELEIRPPDVNFSDVNFTCDAKHQRIFFSLQKIKGVGEVAVNNIINTRKEGGKFFTLEEFISRVPGKVNKTVIKVLIISGAFDLIEKIESPRDRKKILRNFYEMRGETLPSEYSTSETFFDSFWIMEQKKLTGFGEIDYESMIKNAISSKRIANLFVDEISFLNAKEKSEVTVAGKLIFHKERNIKTGIMCTINLDCNNTIIPVVLWPDVYEKYMEEIINYKGSIIAVNGKVDSFKGEKNIISYDGTKIYLILLNKVKQ